MVRERKHQTGASNLSARTENTATVVSANDSKSTFTRAWAHTMIAPDEYKRKALEETRRELKLSATWKPKEIYKRDYQTVHTESYTDFKDIKVEERFQPKSLEQIAAENARARKRQEAVDNMCHLVRNAYGTVATMLRTVSAYFIPHFLYRYDILPQLFSSFTKSLQIMFQLMSLKSI